MGGTIMQEEVFEEEELQPPQVSNRNAVYTSPLDRYGSQISILTDPSKSLHDFELNLRCLKEDEDGNLIKIGGKNWKPLLNDEGINKLFVCVRPIVNPMVPLSNLDDSEVGILMRQLGFNLVDAFMVHPEKYGLNVVSRRVVTGATLEFCYIFLKRPYHEGDRKFFGKITQEINTKQEIKKPNSGSVLNPLNWGRK